MDADDRWISPIVAKARRQVEVLHKRCCAAPAYMAARGTPRSSAELAVDALVDQLPVLA